jgi:UDP-N-acetylglucosamine--N-acetylmuramyl-(pentapeptide) pyrophosphoryl-undecaprenol N-acetylglucosamine transferase
MANGNLRVLIAGGGSGGHVIPALAVAHELVHRYDARVRFVGTARGMETRLVPAAGFPLDLIQVGQLNQVHLTTKLATLAKLPLSVLACRRLLHKFQPHVVFGVGGYASGPAMMAAILSGTPRVAFEPNAVPGMANRWIGRRVQAAAVNFPATLKYFRNGHVTGIPVRPEFFELPPRPIDAPPQLLVFGGSQGARRLNRITPEIAVALFESVPGLTILHQSGARHVEGTQQAYSQSPELRGRWADSWKVEPFLDDMAARFGAASLVLCRSGASTVAELAAAQKPSLLIPFPQAADNHQRCNAEVFVQAGAAAMIDESELTPERLLHDLIRLLKDPEGLAAMAQKARKLAHADAAASIAALVEQCSRRSSSSSG